MPAFNFRPSAQTRISPVAQLLLAARPGGIQNLINPIAGAFIARSEQQQQKQQRAADAQSIQEALQAAQGGGGSEASIAALAENLRFAPQVANLSLSRALDEETFNRTQLASQNAFDRQQTARNAR